MFTSIYFAYWLLTTGWSKPLYSFLSVLFSLIPLLTLVSVVPVAVSPRSISLVSCNLHMPYDTCIPRFLKSSKGERELPIGSTSGQSELKPCCGRPSSFTAPSRQGVQLRLSFESLLDRMPRDPAYAPLSQAEYLPTQDSHGRDEEDPVPLVRPAIYYNEGPFSAPSSVDGDEDANEKNVGVLGGDHIEGAAGDEEGFVYTNSVPRKV
jgi:hypothetical protein